MRVRLAGFIIVIFYSLIVGLIFKALLVLSKRFTQWEKNDVSIEISQGENDILVDSIKNLRKNLPKVVKVVILWPIVSYLLVSLCMRIYDNNNFTSLASWILTILFILVVVALITLLIVFILFLIKKLLWIRVDNKTLVNIWVIVAILGVWLTLICMPEIVMIIWFVNVWSFNFY